MRDESGRCDKLTDRTAKTSDRIEKFIASIAKSDGRGGKLAS